MDRYVNESLNIDIRAKELIIGKDISWGRNIKVDVNGVFRLGDYSRLGSNAEIFGNNITIGDHFFNSAGLRIGGGGRQNPEANLVIGNRCTIHNNFINVCEPISIGNDVGLSPETSILTHGYWMSVLDGFPASFSGVNIGSSVIVGYRSLIMMGVSIIDGCVIGAQSVVGHSLGRKGVYSGSPVRFVRPIEPLALEDRVRKVGEILSAYESIASFHGILLQGKIKYDYPNILFKDFVINVETFEYDGDEDEETDDFRDYMRRWGIRIYTKRRFVSKNPVSQ
jgi:acetyltransferase-like isoleucine patch superfamily enzyme